MATLVSLVLFWGAVGITADHNHNQIQIDRLAVEFYKATQDGRVDVQQYTQSSGPGALQLLDYRLQYASPLSYGGTTVNAPYPIFGEGVYARFPSSSSPYFRASRMGGYSNPIITVPASQYTTDERPRDLESIRQEELEAVYYGRYTAYYGASDQLQYEYKIPDNPAAYSSTSENYYSQTAAAYPQTAASTLPQTEYNYFQTPTAYPQTAAAYPQIAAASTPPQTEYNYFQTPTAYSQMAAAIPSQTEYYYSRNLAAPNYYDYQTKL